MANVHLITPDFSPRDYTRITTEIVQDIDLAMNLLLCASMACRDLMDSDPIKSVIDEASEKLWSAHQTLKSNRVTFN